MTPTTLLLLAALTAPTSQTAEACRLIEPTSAQREARFANAYAFDAVAIRTLRGGRRSCEFSRSEGQCRFDDPQLVHVTFRGRHSWYEADAGRDVLIDVSNGVASCRMLPQART